MGLQKHDLPTRAYMFANRHHYGQTRYNKDKTPLMEHVSEVADLVRDAGGSDIEIAAAWLHDTVEDTVVTIENVALFFGDEVADIVDGLTDPPEFKGLPVSERKKLQAQRVRLKSNSVKLIKIADQISNVRDIALDPPEKWDHKKCLEYTEGALLIVRECRGASEYLYRMFEEVYRLAKKVHQ